MKKNGFLCGILPGIAGLAILAEGSIIFLFAGPTVIEGIGGILKSTIQLAGFQLLVIGLIILASSFFLLSGILEKRRIGLLKNILKVVVVLMGLAVMVEAVVLASMGGRTIIDGFGTFEVYIVAGFAAQLFFLGMAVTVPMILLKSGIGLRKLLVYGGGAAAASSGLIVIGIAAPTIIVGIGGVLARTVELAGVQLFILGLVIVVLSLLLDLTNKFRLPLSVLRYLAALVVAIEGLVLISFATPMDLLGGITSRTVILAGLGLASMGLFTLFVSSLRAQELSPKLRGLTLASMLLVTLLLPMAALTFGNVF